jgi:hypothetical protein
MGGRKADELALKGGSQNDYRSNLNWDATVGDLAYPDGYIVTGTLGDS